jgi:hypothetical protein
MHPIRMCRGTAILGVLWATRLTAASLSGSSSEEGVVTSTPPLIPPPTPPVILIRPVEEGTSAGLRQHFQGGPAGPYSIGEPTDEEQLYVEYINRARADPTAEGVRLVTTTDPDVQGALEYFKVDLDLVKQQFQAIRPTPPVSIHPLLTEAARRHSEDMFQNEYQGHNGTDGSASDQRITDAGYTWHAMGENVYSYVENVWHGHAGFNIDWGNGPGGLQNPPGHRNTMNNALFREVGVGVKLGSKGTVGPQLVTQDFATRQNLGPLLTGVAYFDLNGNAFYDLGEGIGGVTVRVNDAPSYAVTSRSGGYSVPLPGDGRWTVTFDLGGIVTQRQVEVVNGDNVKVDLTPTYVAPGVQGPATTYVGRDSTYQISALPGATRYDWRSSRSVAWIQPEGAEGSLGRFDANVSAGYTVLDTSIKQSGTASFHLAQPAPPRSQYLTLRDPIWVAATSELRFWSRLGVATTNQVARIQYSTDDAGTWIDLWSQAGKGASGDLRFTERRVPIGQLAGVPIRLRITYEFNNGQFYPQVDGNFGLRIDDLIVTDSEERVDGAIAELNSGTSFGFRPSQAGVFALQARARLGDRIYPWGSSTLVTAQEGGSQPAEVRLKSIQARPGGGWEIRLMLQAGELSGVTLESAVSAAGPWTGESQATLEATGSPGEYRALVPAAATATKFYRTVWR